MDDLESYKKEIIETIYERFTNKEHFYRLFDNVHNYGEYYAFMNKMTFDEIFVFVNGRFRENMMQVISSQGKITTIMININAKIRQITEKYRFEVLRKDIADVYNNVQNTTDVVNLFTDIDKNRTSLEEQNKQITNRLDKLENKMDNLEANISQILKLLQKS